MVSYFGCNITRLNKLQKKSIRIICNAKYNAHTDPLFKELKILKLNDMFQLQCLKFYHKSLNNKLPCYFHEFISRNTHRHNKRNTHFSTPLYWTTSAQKRAKYFIPTVLNKMSPIIKEKAVSLSIQGLSNYFKSYCLESYYVLCNVQNCYVCNNVQ